MSQQVLLTGATRRFVPFNLHQKSFDTKHCKLFVASVAHGQHRDRDPARDREHDHDRDNVTVTPRHRDRGRDNVTT